MNKSLAQALKEVGEAINGTQPTGVGIASLIKSIGETYTNGSISAEDIKGIINEFAEDILNDSTNASNAADIAAALKKLGRALNSGTEPTGVSLADILKSMGSTSTGETITGDGLVNILVNIADNWESVTKYTITATIGNGSTSGDSTISEGGTANVSVVPNEGFTYPDSVTVTGATSLYNNASGVIALSAPTGNVSITGECAVYYPLSRIVQGQTLTGVTIDPDSAYMNATAEWLQNTSIGDLVSFNDGGFNSKISRSVVDDFDKMHTYPVLNVYEGDSKTSYRFYADSFRDAEGYNISRGWQDENRNPLTEVTTVGIVGEVACVAASFEAINGIVIGAVTA